ncbi:hypothetical protein F1880_007353 [Penicillium rolfsii]|nr:hypothetical protein F1880_007353 [Penicillium rolfsii]
MTDSESSHLFEQLKAYPFTSDPEFANGLAIILGHAGTPASDAEMSRDDDLVGKAKCFYFSRKMKITPPIDFAAYKAWLAGASSESNAATAVSEQSNEASTGTTVTTTESATAPEPRPPTSFAHIVELIATGRPIPGIQEIPDTVLEGHAVASEKPHRRKPWEKDVQEPAPQQEEMTSNAV